MKKAFIALIAAFTLFTSLANAEPSGTIGGFTRDTALIYGTAAVPGERVIFLANTDAPAFCGISTLDDLGNFLWTGLATDLPVEINILEPSIWALSCIAISGETAGLLASTRGIALSTRSAIPKSTVQSGDVELIEALRAAITP